jgi:hypothetical protein
MNDLERPQHHAVPTARTAVAVRAAIDTDAALDLLQFASSWDNRKPSVAMAEAWATSAELAGWTMVEARAAVQWLGTHERQYLTPAMVTARIESQRRRARLSEDGINPDGTRKVTHAAAVAVWRGAFRSVGPSPSAEQETKAAELLEQMLDDAGDPVTVLSAAVLAGRKMSPRIDWTLEKVAGDEQFQHRMPVCPVEYVRDEQLDVAYAVGQPDFPAVWRVYDPLPSEVPDRIREDYIPECRAFRAAYKTPDYGHPIRDLPAWLVEHVSDDRHRENSTKTLWRSGLSDEERDQEAERYRETTRRVHAWLKKDRARWEYERLAVVRAWYADRPFRRRALEQNSNVGAWWEN